ncbi:MAG: thioredoxin family protein [Daejeonella sp.]
MKNILLSTFLFLSIHTFGQTMNKIIIEKENKPVLIGRCNVKGLNKIPEFAEAITIQYLYYEPDTLVLKSLKPLLKDVKIILVMGTWCDDSKLHVPHFLKIMDKLAYKTNKLNIICVNHEKKTAGKEIEGLNIIRVPTFIFYRAGKEIGRITESPQKNLETDMFNMLSQQK